MAISPAVAVAVLTMALGASAVQQPPIDKAALTAAQKKIDSQLLQVIASGAKPPQDAREPEGSTPASRPRIDDQKRALVDIRIDVTPATRALVTDLGSTIVATSADDRTVIAWVPLAKIETLAADDRVQFIQSAPEPARRRRQ